jgi:hypothetical protein
MGSVQLYRISTGPLQRAPVVAQDMLGRVS